MKFLRYLVGFPVAVVVTSLLFLLMYHLIRQEQIPIPQGLEDDLSIFMPDRPDEQETKKEPDPREEITELDEPDTVIDRTGLKIVTPEGIDSKPSKETLTGAGGGGTDPITIRNTSFYALVTVAPPYPAACAGRGVEGEATVEFDVTNAGNVVNARIVEATDSCFERAALRAVERWKYTPLEEADPDGIRETGLRRTFVFELEE